MSVWLGGSGEFPGLLDVPVLPLLPVRRLRRRQNKKKDRYIKKALGVFPDSVHIAFSGDIVEFDTGLEGNLLARGRTRFTRRY